MQGGSDVVSHVERIAHTLRRHVVEMVGKAGSGHPGGSLSAADIMAVLYFGDVLKVDPANPAWPDRDRFVLSKGHAAPILYAALAERGFFPVEILPTLRQLGSILQGHPDARKVPGVEVSTGSLGQGLSLAVGMALAGKIDRKSYRVWALVGDGESEEGQIWEAAMSAAHYKLDNLTAIVDHNHLQIDGPVCEVMTPEPMADKWRAFGWDVVEVDGHNVRDLLTAFKAPPVQGKPRAIIAETVKGKGVSYMEGLAAWHGKAPKGEELDRALAELALPKKDRGCR
ncbi:MAG: transketolase [Bacillota bacterium]